MTCLNVYAKMRDVLIYLSGLIRHLMMLILKGRSVHFLIIKGVSLSTFLKFCGRKMYGRRLNLHSSSPRDTRGITATITSHTHPPSLLTRHPHETPTARSMERVGVLPPFLPPPPRTIRRHPFIPLHLLLRKPCFGCTLYVLMVCNR